MLKNGMARVIGSGIAGGVVAQVPADTAALGAAAAEHGLMGMSVAVACRGEAPAVYTTGLRDYGRELATTDSTRYRVASVSKAATAIGCAVLAEEGVMDLDADVSQYLGFELRNPAHPEAVITARMLLSHRAGLRDGTGYGPFLTATYTGAPEVPGIVDLVHPTGANFTPNMWGSAAPGAYFSYANVNYGVLASAMEAAANERFDVLMRTRVFAPLGLLCSFNVLDLPDIDEVAVLYRNQGGWTPMADHYLGVPPPAPDLSGYVPGTNGLFFAPQGGLRASAHDLVRLLAVLDGGGGLISSAAAAGIAQEVWAFTGANGNDYYGLFRSWGSGVHRANTGATDAILPGAGPLIGHPGEAYGLISDAYLEPETGWRFAFLTNGAWDGYPLGTSAWYALEEQVFAAIAADYAACSASRVPEVRAASRVALVPNPARPGTPLRMSDGTPLPSGPCTFTRLDGAWAGSSGDGTVPELATGIYFVQWPGKTDRMKLVILRD